MENHLKKKIMKIIEFILKGTVTLLAFLYMIYLVIKNLIREKTKASK